MDYDYEAQEHDYGNVDEAEDVEMEDINEEPSDEAEEGEEFEVYEVGSKEDILNFLDDLERREAKAKKRVELPIMKQLEKDAEQIMKERRDKLEMAKMEIEKFVPDASFKNYYRILGIDRASGLNAINKAYKKLYKKYDPDSPENVDKDTEEKFKDVHEAYEILRDPKERAKYDVLISNMPSDKDSPSSDHVGIYLREQWNMLENSVRNAQKRANIMYLRRWFNVEDLPEIRKAKAIGKVGRKGKIYDKPVVMKQQDFLDMLKSKVGKISSSPKFVKKGRLGRYGKKKKQQTSTKKTETPVKDWADEVEKEMMNVVLTPTNEGSPLKEYDMEKKMWVPVKDKFINGVPIKAVFQLLDEVEGKSPKKTPVKKSPVRKAKFVSKVRLPPKKGKKVGALVPVDPQTGVIVPPLAPPMTVGQIRKGMEKKAMTKYHKQYEDQLRKIEKDKGKKDKKSVSPASGRNCNVPYLISADRKFICSKNHRWVKIDGVVGKKLLKEKEKMEKSKSRSPSRSPTSRMSPRNLPKNVKSVKEIGSEKYIKDLVIELFADHKGEKASKSKVIDQVENVYAVDMYRAGLADELESKLNKEQKNMIKRMVKVHNISFKKFPQLVNKGLNLNDVVNEIKKDIPDLTKEEEINIKQYAPFYRKLQGMKPVASPRKMSFDSLVKKVYNEKFSHLTDINLKNVRREVADRLGKEKLSAEEKDKVKKIVNKLVDEEEESE